VQKTVEDFCIDATQNYEFFFSEQKMKFVTDCPTDKILGCRFLKGKNNCTDSFDFIYGI
jgi:hypothetical protein